MIQDLASLSRRIKPQEYIYIIYIIAVCTFVFNFNCDDIPAVQVYFGEVEGVEQRGHSKPPVMRSSLRKVWTSCRRNQLLPQVAWSSEGVLKHIYLHKLFISLRVFVVWINKKRFYKTLAEHEWSMFRFKDRSLLNKCHNLMSFWTCSICLCVCAYLSGFIFPPLLSLSLSQD